MPAPALSSTIARTQTWPYLAHLYSNAWRGNASDNSAAFKRSLGWLTSTPTLKFSVNSTGHPVTLSLPAAPVGSTAPVQGDIVVLTEQGGDGNVVWAGVIEDVPDDYDVSVKHELIAEYIGIDLDGGTFATTYSAATDIGVMMRAAVGVCTHLWADTTSIPNTGLTRIFDFSGGDYTALRALEEGLKMAGQTYYYFIDPTGRVWFGAANMNTAAYTVVRGQDYRVRRQRVPITNLRNYVPVIGGIPAGQQNPIAAAYDNGTVTPGYPPAAPVSAPSSQYGLRGVTPALKWSRVTDQPTLNAIAATIGGAVNRVQKKIAVEIVGYSKRISLATATGATMRYWEPASTAGLQESEAGTGYSPILVAIDLEVRGPVQKATLSDMPTSLSDLKTLIDRQLDVVGSAGATAVQSGGGGIIVPGQVVGAVAGGPNTPTVPGFYAQGNVPPGFGPISGSTVGALDLTAQAYLDYVDVSFASNPANENVVAYDIRYQKQGETQWSPPHRFPGTPAVGAQTITYRLRGLIPGVAYNFQIRAINYLSLFSAWSATTTTPSTFTNLSAPAVPTGLSAIKTPRGALVSWAPNTEADLRGYDLQVSIGGGAYQTVIQNDLSTSFAYVAPAGTALGTSLTFQVRASNWAANFSAWSAASAAVNTDGIVVDELLAGNIKVFGTLTTGGLQTAASGARATLDSSGFKLYDGSATDWGVGAGVTLQLKNDGSAFFKGAINASTITGGTIAIGSGNAIWKADSNGVYLGNAIFGLAPFSVDMNGNLVANLATIKGTIKVGTGGSPALFLDSFDTDAVPGTDGTLWHSIGTEAGTDNSITYWVNLVGASGYVTHTVQVNAGDILQGGHPDWDDVVFTCRFILPSTTTPKIAIHCVDANNYVDVAVNTTGIFLEKVIAGVLTAVTSAATTLTVSTAYWLQLQCRQTEYTAGIFADSSGAIGSLITSCRGLISDSAVQRGAVALISSGGTVYTTFGGAFNNVCVVKGPVPTQGSTAWSPVVQAGEPAFAWSSAQSYRGTRSLSIYNRAAGGQGYWASANQTFSVSNVTLAGAIRGTGTPTAGYPIFSYGGPTYLNAGPPTINSTWQLVSANGTPTANTQLKCIAQGQGTYYFDILSVNPQNNGSGTARLWMDTTIGSAGSNSIIVSDDGFTRRAEAGNLAAYTGPDGVTSPAQLGFRALDSNANLVLDTAGFLGVGKLLGQATISVASVTSIPYVEVPGSRVVFNVGRFYNILIMCTGYGKTSGATGNYAFMKFGLDGIQQEPFTQNFDKASGGFQNFAFWTWTNVQAGNHFATLLMGVDSGQTGLIQTATLQVIQLSG